MNRLIYIIGFVISILNKEISSSGVFEFRLQKFQNTFGRDLTGKCCNSDEASSSDLHCNGMCLTSFRVCLKHYQTLVDTDTPCTYGDIYTPVLGDKIIEQDYVIKFPFNFTWTATFSLIVEAWHDFNSTTPGGKKLLARHTQQQSVNVGPTFVPASYSNHHTSLHYEYRVTCLPHYYGPGCEVLCRPRDDSFGHFVCTQEGLPKCLPGWEGQYCTKPRCLPGCDLGHGHCTKPGECQCKQGWSGERCDMCLKHPGCDHGTCIRPWECLCEEGWGGLFCNQDLNYCTNHRPCKNGGTCFNTGQGLYTCSCPEGYSGKQCETYLGFAGLTSLISSPNSCITLGCFNGGTCELSTEQCRCLEGFSGPRCENSSPCIRNPCQNGGICDTLSAAAAALRGGNTGYRCKCPLGYSGQHCEMKPLDCDAKSCVNGGQCVTKNSTRVCECINGYFGKFCENSFQFCKTKPCQHYGSCIDLENNNYKCLCPFGYTGQNCETSLREFSEISRQISDNEALLVSELSNEIHGLSSIQIIIIVIISILIPVVALIGALTVVILKRKREIERKKSDNLAKMENEANMITSGAKMAPENVMIHNMLRFGNDTKFINNFENEYATISHSVSDSFYEVPKKPLNTNRFSKDIDKRLSRISIDSSSTNQTGNMSSTYISETAICKDKMSSCNPGPSTSNGNGGPNCIYQSASSCSSMNQSIYCINADSSFQLDDSIVPPGFFATEV